jgi:hypothetical protein
MFLNITNASAIFDESKTHLNFDLIVCRVHYMLKTFRSRYGNHCGCNYNLAYAIKCLIGKLQALQDNFYRLQSLLYRITRKRELTQCAVQKT